jgi:sRNA-binding carbon storage regulator CsrA
MDIKIETFADTQIQQIDRKTSNRMFNNEDVKAVVQNIKKDGLKNVDGDNLFKCLKNGKQTTSINHKQYYLKRAVAFACLKNGVEIARGFNNPENTKILRENINLKAIAVNEKLIDNVKKLVLNIDFKNLYKK